MGWDSSLSDHVSEAASLNGDATASDTPFSRAHSKTDLPQSQQAQISGASHASQNTDTLDSRIHELVLYARDKDSADRSNLFRNLVDMFLTNKAPKTEPTRSQLLDVVEALIPHTDEEFRKTAAELVASMTEPPLDLVMHLIQDRASIISPLLRQANFTEEDLIDIIERTGRSHHQELASRNDLSANVWIALARAAPAIEPALNETALWNDEIFRKKQSATVTPLHPDKHHDIQTTVAAYALPQNAQTTDHTHGVFIDTENQPQQQSYDQRKKASVTTVASLMHKKAQKETQILENEEAPQNVPEKATEKATEKAIENAVEKPLKKAPEEFPVKSPEKSPEKFPEKSPEKSKDALITDQNDKDAVAASWLFDDDDIRVFSDTPKTDESTSQHVLDKNSPSDEGPTNPVKKWDWHCDRRMVVTEINHLSSDIVNSLTFREGSSLIDLLGLSEKPNHPIVKAINRRGTIHDAPLYLKKFPKGHRYWTLEAKPNFCLNTGSFQGYGGCLTGVLPSSTDDNFELPDSLPPAKIHIPDDGVSLDADQSYSKSYSQNYDTAPVNMKTPDVNQADQVRDDHSLTRDHTAFAGTTQRPTDGQTEEPAEEQTEGPSKGFAEGLIEQALEGSLSLSSIPQTQDILGASTSANPLLNNAEDQISALEKTIQSTVESYVGALDIQDMVNDIQNTSNTNRSNSHPQQNGIPDHGRHTDPSDGLSDRMSSPAPKATPDFMDAIQQMEVALNALSQLDLSNPQKAEKAKHSLKLNQTIALACLQSIKDQLED